MILPHPESDLSLNLMVLGAEIIRIMKKKGNLLIIETLLESFLKPDKRRTPDMFFDALTFLFSVGLVERRGYRVKLLARKEEMQRSLFPLEDELFESGRA